MATEDGNPLTRHERVALIGAGVIGASWAALFVAHGLKVTVCDPRAEAEAEVRGVIERSAGALRTLGLEPGRSAADLRFTAEADHIVDALELAMSAALAAGARAGIAASGSGF